MSAVIQISARCKSCGKPLVQKVNEEEYDFRARRHCLNECSPNHPYRKQREA
jgi:hypothetical protein